MDFKRIDSTAYAADRFLDSFLLRRNRDNLQSFRDQRPTVGTWAPHAYNTSSGNLVQPEVSAVRVLGGAGFLLLFPLPPDTDEVLAQIEQKVGSTVTGSPYSQEMIQNVWIQSARAWLEQQQAPTTAEDLEGNASASATTEITLDTQGLPAGWCVVGVNWISGEGTEEEIQDSGGSGINCLTDYWSAYFILDDSASHTIGTGNAVPHYAVRIRDTTDKPSETLGEQAKRQLIHQADNGGGAGANRFYHYVYPAGLSTTPHDSSNDSLWRTPLGNTTLSAITLSTPTIADLPDPRARLDGTQPASVRNLLREPAAQVTEWLTRPRIHCMGPQPLMAHKDWTNQEPQNRVYPDRELSSSYQTLACAPVGDDDAFQRRDRAGSATTYTKTAIEVAFIYFVTLPTNDPGNSFAWDLTWRLYLTDRDQSSNAVSAEYAIPRVTTIRSPTQVTLSSEIHRFDPLGYITTFHTAPDAPQTLERCVFSGPLPLQLQRHGALQLEVLRVKDTNTSPERTLSLQVKSTGSTVTRTSDGEDSQFAPRVHLLTWTVASQSWLTREPSVGEVGV